MTIELQLDPTPVALVTGAGGGIGQALCVAFENVGAIVVPTDLAEAPDHAASQAWMRLDVTSSENWAWVVEDIRKRFGRLDYLINNASVSAVERLTEISMEQWRRVMSVNVESVLLSLQHSVQLLRQSGHQSPGGAAVVNIASAAGLRGVAFHSAYCASKGAATLLTQAAAKEFAALKYPIRVNSIHPSGVETPMTDSILARYVELGLAPSVESARSAALSDHPMGRMARPEEVAGAAVFLCSSAASYMTGAEIVIDGGVM